MNSKELPIVINARDLVTPLERLVTWLLNNNYHNLYIIDNDSSYPPLLEYYAALRQDATVLPLHANVGKTALWDAQIIERLKITTPFVYTDPDIIPIEECPEDVIAFFLDVLDAYPSKNKVGLGLMISDLPDHYRWKNEVIAWESQFWEPWRKLGCVQQKSATELFDSPIDTTFALYRPGTGHDISGIRTGFPYMARHYPWYENSDSPTVESSYYSQRVKQGIGVGYWVGSQLPKDLSEQIGRRIELMKHRRRLSSRLKAMIRRGLNALKPADR